MTRAVSRLIAASALLIALISPVVAGAEVTDELGSYSLENVGETYAPSGWRSSLYPRDWVPGFADSQGRAIADYSYAGYHYGADPLPSKDGSLTVDVTKFPFRADDTGVRDATKAVQAAIEYVGFRGGGVVYLPPGTYRVAPKAGRMEALLISADHVVLRGAGREKTFLYNTLTSMEHKSVIALRPRSTAHWWSLPAGGTNLTADSLAGSMTVRVSNPGSFKIGDLIVIRTEATPEWVASMGSPIGWSADRMDATTYLRRVTSVSLDGRIGIDIPLRSDVLLRDAGTRPNVYPARRHLREVGVEDLSIGMREHPSAASLIANAHESSALRIVNVIDGWVARVGTYAPPANRSGIHMLSEGVWLVDSRNITLRDCIMRYPQDRSAGNGNGYIIRGSDNLIERCVAVGARHSYTFSYWHATGNVLRESFSAHSSLASDFHAWLAATNLIESMRLDGDWIDATFRYSGSTLEHGPSTSQSVIWNTVGVALPATPQYGFRGALVHSVQWGWGAIVGTSGRFFGVNTDPGTDGWRADGYVDLAQGVGEGRTLLPSSLSRDQLARRTRGASYNAARVTGTVLTPTVDARVVSSKGTPTKATVAVRTGVGWQLGFHVPPGVSVTRARLVLQGRSRAQGGAVAVYPAWSAASSLSSKPVARAARVAAPASSPWVFDVTDVVRAASSSDATRAIGLRVTEGIPGLGVHFHSSSGPLALRPRLEIEWAPRQVLSVAKVSPGGSALTDGDLSTYYAMYGAGRTLTVDLGSVRHVSGVGLASVYGDHRFGFSEVRSSTDGVTWRPAVGIVSSGEGKTVEPFMFEAPADARYLQIVSYGSSDSGGRYSNHLSEIEVYGQ